MRLLILLIACAIVSSCGYRYGPVDDFTLQALRKTEPVWTLEIEPSSVDLARCVAERLSGPGTIRIEREPEVSYVRHHPHYRGMEDFEISIRPVANSARQRVDLRHHAQGSPFADLASIAKRDSDEVIRVVAGCALVRQAALIYR